MATLRRRRARWPGLVGITVLLVASPWAAALSPGASAVAPMGAFPPLVLNATATPSTGGIPLTVVLNATASGGVAPYSYNWSFGDGSPNATNGTVEHTYRWVATFHVNVTVEDHLGEFVTVALSVVAEPAALVVGLSAIPSALAAGATTYLVTSVEGGTAPYTFAWTGLPLGCPAQPVKNLSCTPTYGGSYVVTVSVTDARGQVQNSTLGLVVTGPGPPAPPAAPTRPTDFTYAILAVAAVGIAAVAIAAIVGRRARRRRDRA